MVSPALVRRCTAFAAVALLAVDLALVVRPGARDLHMQDAPMAATEASSQLSRVPSEVTGGPVVEPGKDEAGAQTAVDVEATNATSPHGEAADVGVGPTASEAPTATPTGQHVHTDSDEPPDHATSSPAAPPADDAPQASSPPADGSPEPADRVFSGDQSLGAGFVVPPGQTWVFDPAVSTTVTVGANVVVEGTLVMRPASRDVVHTLRFVGVDESRFRGGHTSVPLDSDVGLWVVEDGRLMAEGTPTTGWNRTGTDPSWRTGDDVRVAPQDVGDLTGFTAFTPGSDVPSVTAPDGSVHPAETFNLTRNVRILGGGSNPAGPMANDGRAHVMFLHCHQPQTLRDVELRWLGPRRATGEDGVVGRYPLHFHHCGDAARGSVVERVVVRDSGGHAFVPHASHGITFRDTVAFDNWESAYWWDVGEDNATNDVTFERSAAFLVKDSPATRATRVSGFELGQGVGNAVRDSVVVGALGTNVNAGGFLWPSSANHTESVWDFTGNVAHNNRSAGIAVWQNDFGDHVVDTFTSYRNEEGMHLGSYLNSYHYRDGLSFDETVVVRALGSVRFERLTVGGDIKLGEHKLPTKAVSRWDDLRLFGRFIVQEKKNGSEMRITSSAPEFDLDPGDFVVRQQHSRILVTRSDGTGFEVG